MRKASEGSQQREPRQARDKPVRSWSPTALGIWTIVSVMYLRAIPAKERGS